MSVSAAAFLGEPLDSRRFVVFFSEQALDKKYGTVPHGWEDVVPAHEARKAVRKNSRKASARKSEIRKSASLPSQVPPVQQRLARSSSTSRVQQDAEDSGDAQKFAMLAGMSSFAKKGGTNRILKPGAKSSKVLRQKGRKTGGV
jgi:hypothetical protein